MYLHPDSWSCAGAEQPGSAICYPCSADLADAAEGSVARVTRAWEHTRQLFPMQGMGNFRLGRRTVMYTVETIPKGKNRVLGTIQIMTGFIHISFGIILSTLSSVYTSFFVSGEIPFLGGASVSITDQRNPLSLQMRWGGVEEQMGRKQERLSMKKKGGRVVAGAKVGRSNK
ncbi:hypothetical protein E2320_020647 [Naja naja]|nr:hypothetical protein E2320_020647 [Naja naja]